MTVTLDFVIIYSVGPGTRVPLKQHTRPHVDDRKGAITRGDCSSASTHFRKVGQVQYFPSVGLLLIAAVAFTGCASSTGQGYANQNYDWESLSKVAVVAVTGDIQGEAAKGQITNFFNQQLLRKGYNPIERQQIAHLLSERDFQATGITGTSGAARIGRIINVDAAILINIPNFGEEMSMTAKMIDVEDASILWSGSGSGRTGSGLNAVVGGLAGGAAGSAAGAATGSTGITIAGGAAGAAGGAVAGEALTPQKQEQAQEVIAKLATSLPPSGAYAPPKMNNEQ